MPMSGADLIRAERSRQVAAEGYSAAHDAGHQVELAEAAVCYVDVAADALRDPEGDYSKDEDGSKPMLWPWAPEYWKPTGDPKRDLIKAGALIAAALDAIIAAESVEILPAEGFKR